jgi:diadenosine tetraphosphate (Ap4A) HIT family hydrolase
VRPLAALLLFSVLSTADVRNCACDIANAESMAKHECGLCREAEKIPQDQAVFFLKDINPRKPNRWLALPRPHTHSFADMNDTQRLAFWSASIAKARELFGDQWGLAFNGDESRTQCHTHVHMGKLVDNAETDDGVLVSGPADIPVPHDGSGFWLHARGDKLHLHLGEEITETVLVR